MYEDRKDIYGEEQSTWEDERLRTETEEEDLTELEEEDLTELEEEDLHEELSEAEEEDFCEDLTEDEEEDFREELPEDGEEESFWRLSWFDRDGGHHVRGFVDKVEALIAQSEVESDGETFVSSLEEDFGGKPRVWRIEWAICDSQYEEIDRDCFDEEVGEALFSRKTDALMYKLWLEITFPDVIHSVRIFEENIASVA